MPIALLSIVTELILFAAICAVSTEFDCISALATAFAAIATAFTEFEASCTDVISFALTVKESRAAVVKAAAAKLDKKVTVEILTKKEVA